MSAVKVAKTDIHVIGDDGLPRIVKKGSRIPVEFLSRITNPDAFEVLEVDGPPATEVVSGQGVSPQAAADAQAAADQKAAADQAAAEQADDETPDDAEAKAAAEQAALAEARKAYDPATEAEADKVYAERAYRSLQAAAKARGLKGDGDQATLVARLEADDRDRANS